MATKKRRVKRHNPNKRATRFFERATIWTFEAHRDVNGEQLHPQGMLKTARGDEELEKRIVAGVMYQPAQQWFFAVRVIWDCGNGEIAVDWRSDTVTGRLHGNGQKYWQLRDDVLEKRKLDQIIDVGWIAQTYRSVSPEHEPDRLEAMMQFQLGGMTEYRQQLWREVNEDVKEQREAA